MRIFFALSFISTLIPGIDVSFRIPNDFTYIEIPPLAYYGETQIKVKGLFSLVKERNCIVEIVNSLNPLGKEIYKTSTTTGLFDFTFTYSNFYTTKDIFFRFVESTSGRKVTIRPNFAESPVINLTDTMEPIKIRNIAAYFNDGGVVNLLEQYSFEGFKSLYIPNYYHKLDLTDFKIKIGNDEIDSFRYKSSYLFIYDPYDIFDGFSEYKTDDSLIIPIDYYKLEDGYYSLKSKNTMYVNPVTLQMSLTEKNGYVKTRHIYFPVNQQRNENLYRFVLKIIDLGYNLAYVTHTFTVKTYKNIIGDCHNSEYCVSISSSKGEEL